jgi:hypothetical protein
LIFRSAGIESVYVRHIESLIAPKSRRDVASRAASFAHAANPRSNRLFNDMRTPHTLYISLNDIKPHYSRHKRNFSK